MSRGVTGKPGSCGNQPNDGLSADEAPRPCLFETQRPCLPFSRERVAVTSIYKSARVRLSGKTAFDGAHDGTAAGNFDEAPCARMAPVIASAR
jgi:hypothetical protein